MSLVVPSVDHLNTNKLPITDYVSSYSYNYQTASVFGSSTKIQVGLAYAPKFIVFQ